jgi:hypothetical protein
MIMLGEGEVIGKEAVVIIFSLGSEQYCINSGLFLWGGTKSLGTAATSGLLYKPQMIDEGDCGTIGGMKIGRGNRSTRRKPAPVPLTLDLKIVFKWHNNQ